MCGAFVFLCIYVQVKLVCRVYPGLYVYAHQSVVHLYALPLVFYIIVRVMFVFVLYLGCMCGEYA